MSPMPILNTIYSAAVVPAVPFCASHAPNRSGKNGGDLAQHSSHPRIPREVVEDGAFCGDGRTVEREGGREAGCEAIKKRN